MTFSKAIIPLFLLVAGASAQGDQYDDDFTRLGGGLCYFDSNCEFPCGEAFSAEECLGYRYTREGSDPLDVPYFVADKDLDANGAPHSHCQKTEEHVEQVGRCCKTCDIQGMSEAQIDEVCTNRYTYVNPSTCLEKEGYSFFLDLVDGIRAGDETANCAPATVAKEKVLVDPQAPKETVPPEEEPTRTGSGSGDPHFKTWTGDKFDYHGECDLVLVDNPSFNNGQGLKVHIRTTRVEYFSFIERIAVQIGEDVLEFANDVETFLLNGVQAAPNKKHHKTLLGGFMVRRDKKALSIRLADVSNGGYHKHNTAKINLQQRINGFPAVIVDAGDSDIFKGSLGLLGDWATGSKLGRDGETVFEVDPMNAENFALEWQVRDSEPVLFKDARFPQFPSQCTPPKKIMGSRLGKSHMEEEAKKVCAHFKGDIQDCIFDVVATRSVGAASQE